MRAHLKKPEIMFPLGVFLCSRVFFYAFAYAVSKFQKLNFSTKIFCQWDCSWYLSIINHGYMQAIPPDKSFNGQANWAFFPIVPFFTRMLSSVARIEVLPSAYLIANLSLFVSFVYLYKYLGTYFSNRTAKLVIFFIAFSPVNVYFMSLYTESIYLALLIATVYYIKQHRWITAGILGAFLGATRNTGIFVILLYLFEYRFIPFQGNSLKRLGRYLIGLLLFPSGFLLFMVYLKWRTGDALAFYHIQSTWGPVRGNIFHFASRTLKEHHFSEIFNLLILFLACLSCVVFFVKKRFTELLVLLPVTLTSIYSTRDNYRFFLAIFPMYIILAKLVGSKKWLIATTIVLELLLLLYYINKWITGNGPS